MDKYENSIKLDQMKSLCSEGNYEAAAEIADSINWSKVKNANALVKAGEIYEKVQRYGDSRDVLLMAYDRSPIGRMIIYRLAEVAVKMKDFSAANDYYEEFMQIAPHDSLKYVILYNIKKGQGVAYSELIPILEQFKEQEYSEEWAYELAYLYHKAGKSAECVAACDELILWFGDGPYVERALELKMLYQPLTKPQEEKYRAFRQQKEGYTRIGKDEMLRSGEYIHDPVVIPQVSVNNGRFNTTNLQEEIAKGIEQIMSATEKETVSDTIDNIKKMADEIPYLQISRETGNAPTAHIETDEEIDGSLKTNFQELIGEDSDGQMSLFVPEGGTLERQITGQISISDVLEEWEKTKRAAEIALQDAEQRKLESAKARALQEAGDIMDRLTDVIPKLDAGMTPRDLLEAEYLQSVPKPEPPQPSEPELPLPKIQELEKELSEEEKPEERPRPLPQNFTMDSSKPQEFEIELSKLREPGAQWGSSAEQARTEAQRAQELAAEQARVEAQRAQELAAEQARREQEQAAERARAEAQRAQELAAEQARKEQELAAERARAEAQRAQEQAAERARVEAQRAQELAAERARMEQALAAEQARKEQELAAEQARREQELAAEQARREQELAAEQARKEQAAQPRSAESIVEQLRQEMENEPAAETPKPQEVDIELPEAPKSEIVKLTEAEATENSVLMTKIEEAIQAKRTAEELRKQETGRLFADVNAILEQEISRITDEKAQIEQQIAAMTDVKATTRKMPELNRKIVRIKEEPQLEDLSKEEDLAKEPEPSEEKAEKAGKPNKWTPITSLSDEQKAIFSYFVPVKGMEDQLCKALNGMISSLRDPENMTAYLVVQGSHGCGKTELARSIIRVLQKETGGLKGSVGKIHADALNAKDIQKLLRKLAGGCLIIENAGDITRETAVTLSLLLEQDKSGVLLILEDTSAGIKRALSADDGFAKKFKDYISVPIFTNEDLVSFAQSYARELGYEIDEVAILALHNRISNIQKLDQATTLTEVKEIVDEAIRHEERSGIKKAFGILTAKRYTEDEKIILKERDFEQGERK